jgi:PAS domain S-box-containing protein
VDQDLPQPDEIALTAIELQRRTAMLYAISYAAARIVGSADWRRGIQELIDRLGPAANVSRVTLFEVEIAEAGELVQSCHYDWAEDGLEPLSGDPRYQKMPVTDEVPGELGEWARRRLRGEVVQATLHEVSGYTRQVFLEHGTLSFISVPILVAGNWWGFLGFDDCRQERVWADVEIEVLKTAAALISSALERDRTIEQLRLSEERYALAALGANDGLLDWDVASGAVYFSPRLSEILHLPEEYLTGGIDRLTATFIPTDAARVRDGFSEHFRAGREKFEFEVRCNAGPGKEQWVVLRGLIVYRDGKPRRVVGALRDISRRKNAEAALIATEHKRANLARYFSPNMVEELMQRGDRLDTARIQTATVLFVDLVGFTGFSADLTGLQVIALLREYLGMFEEAVFGNDGTLDKYLGDGLMATFGTPRPDAKDPVRAIACACAMVEKAVAWNNRRRAAGLNPLHLGIGIHTGEVALGEIGSQNRLEMAVVGDTVNIASRIQEMTRNLDIAVLASETTIEAAQQQGGDSALADFHDMGLHALRGRPDSIRLWGMRAES